MATPVLLDHLDLLILPNCASLTVDVCTVGTGYKKAIRMAVVSKWANSCSQLKRLCITGYIDDPEVYKGQSRNNTPQFPPPLSSLSISDLKFHPEFIQLIPPTLRRLEVGMYSQSHYDESHLYIRELALLGRHITHLVLHCHDNFRDLGASISAHFSQLEYLRCPLLSAAN